MNLKQKLVIAAQLAVMGGTAFVLIATSPPPRQCSPAGPIRYAVNGACGPSGYVTVSNDQSCELQVTGAEQLNLPANGGTLRETTLLDGFGLSELVYRLDDGGFDPDSGHPVANADGGVARRFSNCTATPTNDGGTVSVMGLQCFDRETGTPLCDSSLVQDGSLADGGTDGGP